MRACRKKSTCQSQTFSQNRAFMPFLRHALIVFAKVPQPGRVKTRLTTLLSPEQAAMLYEAFLHDALAQYEAMEVDVRLYLSPPTTPRPIDLVPDSVAVREQQGDGLGERMMHAFVESFAEGYERLVVIGTDHPTLPTAFIEQAFAALAAPLSVVIGPSDDGGYYLLGMNDFYPQLFDEMTYSHADVFTQTLARSGDTGAAVSVLPSWYDVDTPELLRRLVKDLEDPSVHAPNTRRALAELPIVSESA